MLKNSENNNNNNNFKSYNNNKSFLTNVIFVNIFFSLMIFAIYNIRVSGMLGEIFQKRNKLNVVK